MAGEHGDLFDAPPAAAAESSAATVRTIEHAEPSALPEVKWFWRRLYIYSATIFYCAHTWWASAKLSPEELAKIVRNDQLLIALLALLYIAGGTTEAIAKLVGAVRTTRKETVTTAPSAATPATIPASSVG